MAAEAAVLLGAHPLLIAGEVAVRLAFALFFAALLHTSAPECAGPCAVHGVQRVLVGENVSMRWLLLLPFLLEKVAFAVLSIDANNDLG